eukprot:Clim_evm5s98 gene=Clim_evmTU5s98
MVAMDEILDAAKATFTLVTTSIGAGILTVPFGFAVLGWWTLIIIAVVSAFMLLGALLLNECLKVSKSFNYVDLAEEHLGPVGKRIVQLALIFTTYFVAIIYVILAASSFQAIFAEVADLSYIVWVVITCAAMWPVGMLPEVKDMVAMLIFAAVCSYGVAIVILYEAGKDLGNPIEHENPELDFSLGVSSVSTFIFAYTFAILIPNTRRNMKYPKNMPYPIILVVGCLVIIYTLVGALDHAAYGCEIPTSILAKWNRNVPWYIGNVMLAGHMLVAAPLLLNPFVITLESVLLKIDLDYTQAEGKAAAINSYEVTVVDKTEAGNPKLEGEIDKLPVNAAKEERLFGSAKNEEGNWFYRNRYGLGRIVLRTIVWATILLISILIPFISNLEEAVVGLALTSQTIVAPMVIYWAIYRDSLSMSTKVFFGVVITLFMAFAVAATYYAIYGIVEAASGFKVFQVPPDDASYLCPSSSS